MVKLWADEQKRHIRPSLWVRQHNMSKPLDQRNTGSVPVFPCFSPSGGLDWCYPRIYTIFDTIIMNTIVILPTRI